MKLIKVEYLGESTEAIFFDVAIKNFSLFGGGKEITKRAFIRKHNNFRDSGIHYANNFQWSDNSSNTHHQFDEAFMQEMILAYEQNK